MKKIIFFSAIITSSVFVIIGMAEGTFAQNRSIQFQNKTFAELKELAKKEGKLIFIDFYTIWCGPCKMMEKEVFVKDAVADFYNKNFINAHVDAEKGEGKVLATKYQVNIYPTLLFVSADENMAHRACGSMVAEQFIELGKIAMNPEKRLSKSYSDYLNGKRDQQFLKQLMTDLKNAGMPAEKVASDYLASQKDADLSTKANWDIFIRHIFDIDSKEFKFALKNYKKLSTLYGDSVVNEKITEIYLKKVQNLAWDSSKDKEKKFNNLKEEIKKINIPQKELLLSRADINFYLNVSDWDKFAKAATSGVIEKNNFYWNNAMKLNQFAWTFYEHVDDTAMLQKAIKWIKRSVELSNWPENNDTYANLLFKIGEIDKAIEVETIALQLAVKDKDLNVKDYRETLKKFKDSKK
ncbi:MAG: thioredoxin family protein [Bacteroidota bacterium]